MSTDVGRDRRSDDDQNSQAHHRRCQWYSDAVSKTTPLDRADDSRFVAPIADAVGARVGVRGKVSGRALGVEAHAPMLRRASRGERPVEVAYLAGLLGVGSARGEAGLLPGGCAGVGRSTTLAWYSSTRRRSIGA